MWLLLLLLANEPLPNRLKSWTDDLKVVQEEASVPTPTIVNGRIITQRWLHVGIRPHVYYSSIDHEVAGAVTLQITF